MQASRLKMCIDRLLLLGMQISASNWVHMLFDFWKEKKKEKLRRGDNTSSMKYGNGDGAVGQRSTHATRRIWTRDPEESDHRPLDF